MRTRLALLLALVLLVPAIGALTAPALAASGITLAQDTGGEGVDGSDEGGVGEGSEGEAPGAGEEDGEGASDPDAETGAGEGETQEAEVEAGPVWTYQMSKILIALLLLMLLAIGGAYWKFVAQRQRAGI